MTENSGIYTPDELFEYFENKFDEVELEEKNEKSSLLFLFNSNIEYCGVVTKNIILRDGTILVSFIKIIFSWYVAENIKNNEEDHASLYKLINSLNNDNYLGRFHYENIDNTLNYIYKFPVFGIDDDFINRVFSEMDSDLDFAKKDILHIFDK